MLSACLQACIVVFRKVKNTGITVVTLSRGGNLKRVSGGTVMKCRTTENTCKIPIIFITYN